MSKYNDVMKLMEDECGNSKEIIIALATVSLSVNAVGNPCPDVRMVSAYYEDEAFLVSTDARKTKPCRLRRIMEFRSADLDVHFMV